MAFCDLVVAYSTVETLCWITGVGLLSLPFLWGGY